MKSKMNNQRFALWLLCFAFVVASCRKDTHEDTSPSTLTQHDQFIMDNDNALTGQIIPGKYIVVFKTSAIDNTKFKQNMSYAERGDVVKEESLLILNDNAVTAVKMEQVFNTVVTGFSANLSDQQVQSLLKDSRIDYIEPDRMIVLGKPGGKPGSGGGTPPPQSIPWGITRVGGGGISNYEGTKRAWIIDTGIDLNHPDLNVNTALSRSFLGGITTPDDQNGHGTHVSGTIGALNNSIGVIGVVPGVEVVAVRVLDRNGSGSTSGVIAGVDYVGATASAGDVANMSLGGGISTALDNAVINAAANGIYFAIAAGNSAVSATNSSPARVNGAFVFTVSAMSSGDLWASFSNYGNPPVDFCAPGVSIYSTWLNGGYNTISGTSMATPHVAGIIIANGGPPIANGTVSNDPDLNPDMIAHVQ